MKVDLHFFGLYLIYLYATCSSICIQIIYLEVLNKLKYNNKKRQPPKPLWHLCKIITVEFILFESISSQVPCGSTVVHSNTCHIHWSSLPDFKTFPPEFTNTMCDSAICKWRGVCVYINLLKASPHVFWLIMFLKNDVQPLKKYGTAYFIWTFHFHNVTNTD